MLNLIDPRPTRPKCDGSTRREFLQAGSLSIAGLTLADLLRARAAAATAGKAVQQKSVILLFLDGGASHIETFDPKMTAPKEYRSLFDEVPTRIPGITFGGLFPKMAAMADKMAIIRSFTHKDGDHGGATHWLKTGYPWPPEFLGKAAVIPQQSPSIGSIVSRYRGPLHRETGVPTYVRVLSNHQGYPGDDAVWLGQDYNPFRVGVGSGRGNPMLSNMGLKVPRDRLEDRRSLLKALDTADRSIDKSGVMNGIDSFQEQAVNVLLGRAKEAFDLSLEPQPIRDRYGPGLGQEMLLARRLVEAGAGFVTLNNGYWDHHGGIIPGCKQLCPPLDHVVEVFTEDLYARGLEKDVLLVITGEFGRTPRVNGGPGRDHWAGLNPLAFIGGGFKVGQVIGESDEKAAYPKSRPIWPQDFMATLFRFLDIDPTLQYVHPSGRPINMIDDGKPIEELF